MLHDIKLLSQNGTNISFQKKNNPVEKDYLNSSLWEFYKNFDDNQNNILENKEIEKIKELLLNAAGEDKILDDKELDRISKQYGIPKDIVKKSIITLSADTIADDIQSNLQPGMLKRKDMDAAADLIHNKINKNNVTEIWDRYQLSSDIKNSLFNLVLVSDTSLSTDILKNYPLDEAAKLLKKLVSDMAARAQDAGVDVKDLIQNYNTALKNNDKKTMDLAVRELGARLTYDNKLSVLIKSHVQKIKQADITETNRIEAEYSALNAGLQPTDDIVGDNVLGNTKTKANTKEAKVVLDILNKLMSESSFKERVDACIKKENNCFGIYFPNINRSYCTTENGLITSGLLEEGVVGDGDMSALVASIMRQMQIDNIKTSNPQEVEKYIKELFTPKLTGRFRPIGK